VGGEIISLLSRRFFFGETGDGGGIKYAATEATMALGDVSMGRNADTFSMMPRGFAGTGGGILEGGFGGAGSKEL
jgi:hypothetical protein